MGWVTPTTNWSTPTTGSGSGASGSQISENVTTQIPAQGVPDGQMLSLTTVAGFAASAFAIYLNGARTDVYAGVVRDGPKNFRFPGPVYTGDLLVVVGLKV